jgi:hypothetical protein
MKLMVADLKGLVLLAYPLVTFGGMMQLNNVWASTYLFTTKMPVPTNMHLFMIAALLYPAMLTGFFRLDGRNPLFPLMTVGCISAMVGLFIYPLLYVIGPLVGFPPSLPLFHVVVLLLDVIGAFAILFSMTETDLQELPNGLIFGSLFALEMCAVVYVMGYYEVPQQIMAKLVGGK